MASELLTRAGFLGAPGETAPPEVGEREEPAPPTYYAIPLVLLALGGVFWWWRTRKPGR